MEPVINSSLAPGFRAKLIEKIEKKKITDTYLSTFDVDISPYLFMDSEENEIGVYECDKTNYRFYSPAKLQGGAEFYNLITRQPAYYNSERWEWPIVVEMVGLNEKVLEVGAGGLAFMSMAKQRGLDITGLEINPHSMALAKEKNLTIYDELIEDFSKKHENEFDVVCSFHVLEHIYDVHSFLYNSIKVLKKGGRLIISVPNNDSFMKSAKFQALNLPPHHMGLWTDNSLKAVSKVFNLKVETMMYEPLLDKYRIWYYVSMYQNLSKRLGIAGKVIGKVIRPFFGFIYPYLQKHKKGPNVLICFRK